MSRKTLFFDGFCGYTVSAVVENGKITEFSFEQTTSSPVTGNIYKGRVESVLPGMNAAFINCGLERNCYLSFDDLFQYSGKYDGEESGLPSAPELKEGDEIAVQVIKPPVGKKGARVTVYPSFIGKYLIYLPRTPFVGVSRKIADVELRKNLVYSAGRLKTEDEGLVFRTEAPYAKLGQIEQELGYLRNMHAKMCSQFKNAKVGDMIYSELELPIRVMRDTLSYDIERIIVGSEKLERIIRQLVKLYPDDCRRPVILHATGRDMFDEYGLAAQIAEIASPRVELENGAYLVIEKTEALTVIDVNTGKFTGDDSLEQTVYFTNILAAREIARQVKLRNIGGITVVDFIDMTSASHNKSLTEELERALFRAGLKCDVSPMSKFGLVEFTRKRSGITPLSAMTKPCRYCRSGYTKTNRYILMELRARLLNVYADGNKVIRADINSGISDELNGWKEFTADLKKRLNGAEVYFVPHKSYAEEQINIRCKGEDGFCIPDNSLKLI